MSETVSDHSPHQRERAWHFYLDDMIAFAEKAADYPRGLDQAAFVFDQNHRPLAAGLNGRI
ncbi:MAG: hypothetical protein EOM91_10480 [Sphingobacteriia bacterium]|nr:hypothetical protein [Sphingobacteriia bacterium]NCC41039.1 hypothetical protein [Gammaproteobacteria bacterium]